MIGGTTMTKKDFEERCYRAYQLDWMISQGYSLHDLKEILTGIAVENVEAGLAETLTDAESVRTEATDLTDSFLDDTGFHGSLFVCKDEFLGAEYLDEGYMKHLTGLMSDSDRNFKLWQKYSGQKATTDNSPISRVLTISTAHIDGETADGLDDKDSDTYGLSVYEKGDYGWWIYIPESWKKPKTGFPQGLAACIDLAVRNDCNWLCLDQDAEEVEGLPVYDW